MNKEKRLKEQNRVRAKKRRRVKKVEGEELYNEKYDVELIDSETSNSLEARGEETVHELKDLSAEDDSDSGVGMLQIIENMSTVDEDGNISFERIAENDSSSHEGTSESSDENDENNNEIPSEIEKLQNWAIECKIQQFHLDKLLDILRVRLLPTLPKSSKTFLRTNHASYKIQNMEDSEGGTGEFLYFGIANGLQDYVNKNLHEKKEIDLQVHADGMPLTKSSTEHAWVLSGKVHFDPDIYKPLVIAIFYGKNKPKSSNIFLDDFVKEINLLTIDGILIDGSRFDINLKCIIADTPARAFLKDTVGHVATFACERCTVRGVKVDGSTVYSSVTVEGRTDKSFRNFDQPDHHHAPSAFLRLIPSIDMIRFFVLDFMHSYCQGAMKKLLEYWMSGSLNYKLSSRSNTELADRLKHIRNQTPREFQRKIGDLKSVLKWKATELRFFLLNCGPIVLKNLLSVQLYTHFLLLHSACRILCCEKTCLQYLKQAKEYLKSFFIAMKDFYGEKSQTLNAHHLIHWADDVMFLRCSLSYITAFPFEKFLGKIKKYLRTTNRPLAQVSRRLFEEKQLGNNKPNLPPNVEILKYYRDNSVKAIKYKGLIITTAFPDNMMILEDQTIIEVQEFYGNSKMPEFLEVKGVVWDKKKPLFSNPCDSQKLQMWEMNHKSSKKVLIRKNNFD